MASLCVCVSASLQIGIGMFQGAVMSCDIVQVNLQRNYTSSGAERGS